MSFYQSGRDLDRQWNGAGTVLKAMVIESACKAGFRVIDLLRGPKAYKHEWADESRPVVRARAASGLPVGSCCSRTSCLGARRCVRWHDVLGLSRTDRTGGERWKTVCELGREDRSPRPTGRTGSNLGRPCRRQSDPVAIPLFVVAGGGRGPDAHVVLVFDGDELLGGAPFVEERRRGVRRYRLATAGSEHGLDLCPQRPAEATPSPSPSARGCTACREPDRGLERRPPRQRGAGLCARPGQLVSRCSRRPLGSTFRRRSRTTSRPGARSSGRRSGASAAGSTSSARGSRCRRRR